MKKENVNVLVTANVGVADLKSQKQALNLLAGSGILNKKIQGQLDGITNLYDHIGDVIVSQNEISEDDVFDIAPDEEKEPEKYKAHTDAYQKNVNNFLENVYAKVSSGMFELTDGDGEIVGSIITNAPQEVVEEEWPDYYNGEGEDLSADGFAKELNKLGYAAIRVYPTQISN